ncbi:MAG: response regulator [Bdellovibrionales bacterium]
MLQSIDSTENSYIKGYPQHSKLDYNLQKKLKVLLIDDDQDLGRLLTDYMSRKFACRVKLATDSFEAMNLLTEEFFDLIILDWKLPALTGGQTLQLLEQGLYYEPELPIQWDTQKAPVIIFSSHDKNQCVLKSRTTKHFNVVGYVSKKQGLKPIMQSFGHYLEGLKQDVV